MTLNDLLYEKQGSIALITLNRLAMLNAFRDTTMQEFILVLDEAAADDSVRVVVITGNGRAFSAGADLDEMNRIADGDISLRNARASLKNYQQVTRKMLGLQKPIIAALNGLAVGVGAEIALASDIRLASESAYFAFAEVRRALFETNGVMYILPRLVGMGRAMTMLLTGNKITAAEALQIGLVSAVYPAEEVVSNAFAMAQRIASNAPISVKLIKQLLHRSYDIDLESVMLMEEDGMMACLASDDLREGVMAFAEKREPQYSGK